MSSLFKKKKLSKLRVACRNSFLCIQLFDENVDSQITAIEYLACLTSFLLLDVIHIWIAKDEHTTEAKHHIALTRIIELVWFVPGGEHAFVLMGCRSYLTWLKCPLNAAQYYYKALLRILVFMRGVVEGIVDTHERVRIHKLEEWTVGLDGIEWTSEMIAHFLIIIILII